MSFCNGYLAYRHSDILYIYTDTILYVIVSFEYDKQSEYILIVYVYAIVKIWYTK